MNTNTYPKTLAILQAVGLAAIEGILAFLANAANLQSLVNPTTATIVAALALAIENAMYDKTGKSLFGTINL